MIENTPNLLSMQQYPRGGVKTTGKLCISSNPSQAYIYVDGLIATSPTGESKKTPSCLDVQEGRRDITIRLEGYDDVIRYADIYPGKTTSINVNLKSGKPGKITPFGLAGLYFLAKMFI